MIGNTSLPQGAHPNRHQYAQMQLLSFMDMQWFPERVVLSPKDGTSPCQGWSLSIGLEVSMALTSGFPFVKVCMFVYVVFRSFFLEARLLESVHII